MTILNGRTTTVVAAAIVGLLMTSIWLMLKPAFVTGSTFAMFAAVVICMTAIAINSWRNAQPPTSTSEVIQEAESGRRS